VPPHIEVIYKIFLNTGINAKIFITGITNHLSILKELTISHKSNKHINIRKNTILTTFRENKLAGHIIKKHI
jgi:hypothetical protein